MRHTVSFHWVEYSYYMCFSPRRRVARAKFPRRRGWYRRRIHVKYRRYVKPPAEKVEKARKASKAGKPALWIPARDWITGELARYKIDSDDFYSQIWASAGAGIDPSFLEYAHVPLRFLYHDTLSRERLGYGDDRPAASVAVTGFIWVIISTMAGPRYVRGSRFIPCGQAIPHELSVELADERKRLRAAKRARKRVYAIMGVPASWKELLGKHKRRQAPRILALTTAEWHQWLQHQGKAARHVWLNIARFFASKHDKTVRVVSLLAFTLLMEGLARDVDPAPSRNPGA